MAKEGDVAAGDNGDQPPRQQIVYFIRHAESRWNRAQAEFGLISMMWENDHGLSDEGRGQAEALRATLRTAFPAGPARELPAGAAPALWVAPLLKPDIVYASPFTRTLSTAVIGLRDILPKDQLVLMREAREQKNFGGADSTGVATGPGIVERLEDEIHNLYDASCSRDQTQAALQSLREVQLDTAGCHDEWWGPMTGDAEEDLLERIGAFVARLRTTRGEAAGGGGGSTVVVGHSLFFRTLFSMFLGKPEGHGLIGVAASLQRQVLPFCGIVGTRFKWDEHGRARIVEAVPLLGTKLREVEPDVQRGGSVGLGACVCGRGKNEACNIC